MDHIEESILKIIISFAIGAVLGFEREYHDKPAGLRTIILITVGSTLFTMVSVSFGINPERVASNIVTGIGFIGAGVMFRQGVDVKGITTAATVWMAAALGMGVAQELYVLSAVALIIVLGTLAVLNRLETKYFLLHRKKAYHITFENAEQMPGVENLLHKSGIQFTRVKISKKDNKLTAIYKITGNKHKHNDVERMLAETEMVCDFEA